MEGRGVCARDSCPVRVSWDGHPCCSTHSPCYSDSGFDPESCPVCSSWVNEIMNVSPSSRSTLPAFLSLRNCWNRAKKISLKRNHHLAWVDHNLMVQLGLTRSTVASLPSISRISGEVAHSPARVSTPEVGSTRPPQSGPLSEVVHASRMGHSLFSPQRDAAHPTSPSYPESELIAVRKNLSYSEEQGRISQRSRGTKRRRRSSDSSSSPSQPRSHFPNQPSRTMTNDDIKKYIGDVLAAHSSQRLDPNVISDSSNDDGDPVDPIQYLELEQSVASTPPAPAVGTPGYQSEAWSRLPASWICTWSNNKLTAFSPATPPDVGHIERKDVYLNWKTEDDGTSVVYYKPHPPSNTPQVLQVTPKTTLDSMAKLLQSPLLNPDGQAKVSQLEGKDTIVVPSTVDLGKGSQDWESFFRKAMDDRKPAGRHTKPQSFPVRLPESCGGDSLRRFLWPREKERLVVPYQLHRPNDQLMGAEWAARQQLAHLLSSTVTASFLRDWAKRLSLGFNSLQADDLRDILSGMSTVADGLAASLSSSIPMACRKAAECRLAARKAAIKDLYPASHRLLMRSSPLSASLLDQLETDKVIGAQPSRGRGASEGQSSSRTQ
ncbi:hypothetical protein Pcinc_022251 [Petrolisthes cinctipes]|uniref:Uncharacterized protein n=1 Tax=Petrolisthes cinctipes TaxID=88211 RepID=A0AAE1FFP4_PETCI|nr:hypothetical protein Pcinc_022251 [Petrolisthes cinctipes]